MVTPEQKAAYIIAQAVCALAEIAGAQAENQQRAVLGQSMAYGGDVFDEIIERYQLGHNAVLKIFGDGQ